jgi:hypothetical protein
MGQFSNFLTRSDVVKFAGLGSAFPVCDVQDVNLIVEFEFYNCLGIELFEAMKEKIADYSTATAWVSGTTLQGATVTHKGTYWTAKVDTTTEPLVENANWSLATKFVNDGDCGTAYNEFWCNYLAVYLAIKVAISSARTNVAKLTASGITVATGEGFIPANSKERNELFIGLQNRADMVYSNMKHFMNKYPHCFPSNACGLAQPCKTNCTIWAI